MDEKYKVTRSKYKELGGWVDVVKVTNTKTGKSAEAKKWDYDAKRDILQEAIDKLRANE